MSLGLARNKRYKQGFFYPEHPEKYVSKEPYAIYRSGLELKYFKFLDSNPKCLKWNSEGIQIPYYWSGDNKWHTYYVDLIATFKEDNKDQVYLIEIKPYKQTQKPEATPRKHKKTLLSEQVMYSQNQAKWDAASTFAHKNKLKFIILTEKEIG